eukprot:gene10833-10636_t
MLVTFRNAMGEKKTYSEEGFSIYFNPTITGEVIVLLQPHYSDMDKELPALVTLAVFPDPAELNSTGQYGESEMRTVELATGKVLHATKMDGKYFGEGMTVLGGKIYQLTYREGKGFVYDAKTLKQTGSFTFNTPE